MSASRSPVGSVPDTTASVRVPSAGSTWTRRQVDAGAVVARCGHEDVDQATVRGEGDVERRTTERVRRSAPAGRPRPRSTMRNHGTVSSTPTTSKPTMRRHRLGGRGVEAGHPRPVVGRQVQDAGQLVRGDLPGDESLARLAMKRVCPPLPRAVPRAPRGTEPRGPRADVRRGRRAARPASPGYRRAEMPCAASRNDRSSESTVVDSAASRFASATSDARSAACEACSAADWARTASPVATSATTSTVARPTASRRVRRRAAASRSRPVARLGQLGVGPRLGGIEEAAARPASARPARRPPSPARRRGGPRGTARRPARRRRATPARPGSRCRRTARPTASSSSQRANRGHAVSSASWATSRRSPSTTSSRRTTKASTTARRPAPSARVELQLGEGTGRRTSAPPSSTSASRTSRRRASAPARLVKGRVGVLGGPAERAGDAAGLEVAGEGQPVRPAAAPRCRPAPSRAAAEQRAAPRRRPRRRRGVRPPPSGRPQPLAPARPRAVRVRSVRARGRAPTRGVRRRPRARPAGRRGRRARRPRTGRRSRRRAVRRSASRNAVRSIGSTPGAQSSSNWSQTRTTGAARRSDAGQSGERVHGRCGRASRRRPATRRCPAGRRRRAPVRGRPGRARTCRRRWRRTPRAGERRPAVPPAG